MLQQQLRVAVAHLLVVLRVMWRTLLLMILVMLGLMVRPNSCWLPMLSV